MYAKDRDFKLDSSESKSLVKKLTNKNISQSSSIWNQFRKKVFANKFRWSKTNLYSISALSCEQADRYRPALSKLYVCILSLQPCHFGSVKKKWRKVQKTKTVKTTLALKSHLQYVLVSYWARIRPPTLSSSSPSSTCLKKKKKNMGQHLAGFIQISWATLDRFRTLSTSLLWKVGHKLIKQIFCLERWRRRQLADELKQRSLEKLGQKVQSLIKPLSN